MLRVATLLFALGILAVCVQCSPISEDSWAEMTEETDVQRLNGKCNEFSVTECLKAHHLLANPDRVVVHIAVFWARLILFR